MHRKIECHSSAAGHLSHLSSRRRCCHASRSLEYPPGQTRVQFASCMWIRRYITEELGVHHTALKNTILYHPKEQYVQNCLGVVFATIHSPFRWLTIFDYSQPWKPALQLQATFSISSCPCHEILLPSGCCLQQHAPSVSSDDAGVLRLSPQSDAQPRRSPSRETPRHLCRPGKL